MLLIWGREMTCLDVIANHIGDLARPYAIIVTSTGFVVALMLRVDAVSLGVAATLVGTLYGAKSYENAVASKAAAPALVNGAQ